MDEAWESFWADMCKQNGSAPQDLHFRSFCKGLFLAGALGVALAVDEIYREGNLNDAQMTKIVARVHESYSRAQAEWVVQSAGGEGAKAVH